MRHDRLIVLAPLLFAACAAPVDWSRYPVVPRPAELAPREGAFRLDGDVRIVLAGPEDGALADAAELFAGPIRRVTGLPLPVTTGEGGPGTILLAVEPDPSADRESYALRIDAERIRLTAPSGAGVFRGLQTLRQLLPPSLEAGAGVAWRGSPATRDGAVRPDSVVSPLPTPAPEAWREARGVPPVVDATLWIPAVEIEDAPRFRYRGLHLDVGRHVFPVTFVKKYIDLLALYRFNTFHWHLTEDQGWRIEIRSYPRLTEVGAWRAETQVAKYNEPYRGDGRRYGGHYTREEVREVVAYARARHIVVIPEIELPGHSRAALAAYPGLGCGAEAYEVATRWGVFPEIYCPKEETFAFLENVLLEVMELFPSEYIHIGGDEAPKEGWAASPVAQEVMAREGLADEHELQSWFIRRIERFLNAHGRRLIGWDEILEGGLPPDATVMSWRGTEGGMAAARAGHDVVMTPNDDVYLDHYQGDPRHEPLAIGGLTTLRDVYAFEPVPEALSTAEARHVIGTQGNVWTEYLPTADHVEYMAYPRALALAEVAWSPREVRDWNSFVRRLPSQLARLDALDVHYRVPPPGGLHDRLTLDDSVTLRLDHPVPGTVIWYTTDGSPPSAASAIYREPLRLAVDDSVAVRAMAFPPASRPSPERSAVIRRTTLRTPGPVNEAALEPGLRVVLVADTVRDLEALAGAAGDTAVYESVGLTGAEPEGALGLAFQGLFLAPADGIYTFRLMSDDHGRLRVGRTTLAVHEAASGVLTSVGQVALAAGWHPIALAYADHGGRRVLRLELTDPDGRTGPVPGHRLRHRRESGGP